MLLTLISAIVAVDVLLVMLKEMKLELVQRDIVQLPRPIGVSSGKIPIVPFSLIESRVISRVYDVGRKSVETIWRHVWTRSCDEFEGLG